MVARVRPIETDQVFETAVELARYYLQRDWQPVPIDRGQKRPRDNAWQSLGITDVNVENYFGNDDNVGVQLGARSNGLTDVDIDCAEASKYYP
jgi:Bifunctional DNA primase/polymerase, N-terminal